MAEDRVDIELNPIIPPDVLARIKSQIGSAASSGATGGGGGGSGGGSMGGALAMAGGTAGLVAAGGAMIGGAALSTVGTANPAVMEQFNAALTDITGVIGHALTPVLEIMTEGVRMFGDLLASIIPDTSQILDPLMEVMQALREAIDPLIPLIKGFLTESLKVLAEVVKAVANAMVFLLSKIPGANAGAGNWSSSMGAAAGGTDYSSAANLNRGAIAGAFGMGGGMSAPERTAKAAEKTASDTEKILAILQYVSPAFGLAKLAVQGFPSE